eukprot:3705095-Amphidinium_carterae.1
MRFSTLPQKSLNASLASFGSYGLVLGYGKVGQEQRKVKRKHHLQQNCHQLGPPDAAKNIEYPPKAHEHK